VPTYTVHAPPPRKGALAPECFVFLRDGFHVWAFIAPALWLLVYRLWLAFVLYIIIAGGIIAALVWLGAGTLAVIAAGLCISLLIGFEAASIRRWTLARRRWAMLGFVVGENRDSAEQRFFARWTERPQEIAAPAESTPPPPPRFTPRPAPDVIGLFPQPGGTR
jgi:hypothetical protein